MLKAYVLKTRVVFPQLLTRQLNFEKLKVGARPTLQDNPADGMPDRHILKRLSGTQWRSTSEA